MNTLVHLAVDNAAQPDKRSERMPAGGRQDFKSGKQARTLVPHPPKRKKQKKPPHKPSCLTSQISGISPKSWSAGTSRNSGISRGSRESSFRTQNAKITSANLLVDYTTQLDNRLCPNCRRVFAECRPDFGRLSVDFLPNICSGTLPDFCSNA